jgi:hypothetical protein
MKKRVQKKKDSGLKDSGKREQFDTGAVREPNLDRGRYDLISPIALRALAIHYERGATKYSERNWEKGLPLSRHLNSALRHLQDFLDGDTSEDHLSACSWNCFCIIHIREKIKQGQLPAYLNDLPNQYVNVEVKCDGIRDKSKS